jgi:hypothetical protein
VIAYDAAAGAFVTHPVGTALQNFPLDPGRGYFLRCTAVAQFQGNAYGSSGGTFKVAGYSSLDAWRSARGQEMLDGTAVGMEADPLLVAPGGGGTIGDTTRLATLSAYRLQSGSPCADSGLDILSLFGIAPGDRDFYGNGLPEGPAFDIGAHEYAEVAVPLAAGYTLIALPLVPSVPLTAEGLVQQINAQGGGATQIVRYDETAGQFVTHPVGTALQNFTLQPGRGYFVRCTRGSVWTVSR